MSAIKYEIGKSYPVRNGGRAIVGYVFENGNAYGMYSHDAAQDYVCPIVFLPDGRAEYGPTRFDILPPEPEKRVVWACVYASSAGLWANLYGDREAATKNFPESVELVGCHRIELRAEFEEDAP